MSDEKDLQDILKNFEPQSSELKGFAAEQMLNCEKCNRANPPTRTVCLYCGADLPVMETASTHIPKLKRLEDWEIGYNIILLSNQPTEITKNDLYAVANSLNLKVEDLQKIVELKQSLPIARAGNPNEAALVEKGLKQLGIDAVIVSDYEMAINTPSQRLLGVTFTETNLIGRTMSNERALNVEWDDVRVIVVGRIIEKRIETEEKVSRKEIKELEDSRELSTDQIQLDIYTKDNNIGWRILADKFDYSCLGEQRSLTAAENFKKLIERLRHHAKQAVFDDSYNRVQSALSLVWAIERRNESLGLKRKNFGRAFSRFANITSNETQFLRYSRLKVFLGNV
jgi:hypothetical protein